MPLLRSTTARLFIPLVVLQLLATGGVLSFVWASGQQAVVREQQALIGELRDDLIADYRQGGVQQLRDAIRTRLQLQGDRAPILLLTEAGGRPIAGNLAALPAQARTDTDWSEARVRRLNGTGEERVALTATTLPAGARLVAGIEIGRDVRLRRSYQQALAMALLLALPLALAVTLLTSRMVARRLHSMAQTAHQVGAGGLDARVPLDGSNDSFDELAHAVNTMLDRIEALVSELRLVTDGLAHDLRSPVTRLKSTIEQAMREVKEPAALAALDRAEQETEALNAMLATALQISRAEAGIGRESFTETPLAPLTEDLAELYGPLAEAHGFALVAEPVPADLAVSLQRELLGQALGNMIDNAIKYARGGDTIRIFARPRAAGLAIGVEDNGPGIPADSRDAARRRFGRLDPARGISGSGLGLALVEAVARLHGGAMELEDAQPGLRIAVVIPHETSAAPH